MTSAAPVRRRARPAARQADPCPVSPCLGRYVEDDTGATREIAAVPGAQGSTLVVDRLAGTHADARLLAHLAPDEPPGNARLLCSMYLADRSRGRCRPVTAEDRSVAPFATPPAADDDIFDRPLFDATGVAYRIRTVAVAGSSTELCWTRSQDPEGGEFDVVTLRHVVGALQDYEPARTMTAAALPVHGEARSVSVHRLAMELERLSCSRTVLNRRLREVVLDRVARGELSMSVIATRCGRVKRDRRGNVSGETSWLARRIGRMPESGEHASTPWVSSDVLTLIARALGVDPHEVELVSPTSVLASPGVAWAARDTIEICQVRSSR